MITSKTFVTKTRKGSVLKIVREHYLRDDIWCGSKVCASCCDSKQRLQKNPESKSQLVQNPHYIIPDTNVVLHQMDVLEDPIFQNVILLQTVLKEVRHRHTAVYNRLKEIWENKDRHFYIFINEHHKDTFIEPTKGESANDKNDRAIRVAAKWYKNHLNKASECIDIVLLTNDRENMEKAKQEGLISYTFAEYVKSITKYPELSDKLAHIAEETSKYNASQEKELYPLYLTLSQLHAGIKAGKFLQGKYHASRENFLTGHVFTSDDQKESDSVLIQGRLNINRAIDGDIVAVEMLPKTEWSCPSALILDDRMDYKEETDEEVLPKVVSNEQKPTGKIVGIIKRNWRRYCGIIQSPTNKEDAKHLFIPSEKRIPKIKIETRQASSLVNKRIIVSIDSWPRFSKYPLGHYVEVLGDVGDKDVETEVILLEHDVPHQSFSQAVLNCLPSLPWTITDEDVKKRVDLRHLDICSVDPPGCTDIDDALHCRKLKNGNFEVGVHIADVSHFITPGTAIDKEAASRGNTVYLIDKRIDMVPELLSSNLCSLRGNEERFSFSCIWELNSNANILKTTFCKSIIKSRAAFTYEEAQLIIDDKRKESKLAKSLRNLNKLAKILKQRRIDNGALTLASTEIRFAVDAETRDPIEAISKELRETNSMVEEFMLLANISTAEYIFEKFPEFAVLRRHPAPAVGQFELLIKAGLCKGFKIETESGKSLSESLDDSIVLDNPYFNTMLRMIATRCMCQAVYFCSGTLPKSDYFHYGLAVPIYTHFTSPIRRYPDILVHRLLAIAIGAGTTDPSLVDKRAIQEICNNLNYRHRMAQYAGRASSNLYAHLLLKDKVVVEEGYVLYVGENGLKILIPKYGIEVMLYLKPTGNAESNVTFVFNEEKCTQTAEGVTLSLFDAVMVQLSLDTSNVQHPYILAKLVKPMIKGFSIDCESAEPPKKKKRLS